MDLRDAPDARAPAAAHAARRDALVALGVGVAVALAFTLAPPLRFMGWFVRALFHETGHVVASWLAGCPAFPAISLQGHAAAFHQPQRTVLALLVGALLAWGVVCAWRARRFRAVAVGGLVLWGLVAFSTGFREVVFLLGGHLGEIGFAWFFLRRARTGEGVERSLERPLYAGLGWYFVASNALLGGGLAVSNAARAAYASNGSFGMENDYVRVARELGVSIGVVGIGMALVALAAVPLALLRFEPRPAGDLRGLRPVRW